jgi:zinc/manganese transport system permease protein
VTPVHKLYTWVFEPGLFSNAPVHVAALIGGVVAVVSAVVGVFTVIRGQSFGGHALGDVSAAGGSGALLIGLNPLLGFVGLGIVGGGVMDMIGVRRVRGRDLATGIVLGAAIGLSALFLYLDTTAGATTGATQQILFGSIFTISSGTIPFVAIFSVISLASIAAGWRPLLLSTVSTDIAAARGVPVRLVGLLYMLALAISVGLSSLAVGAILSTALLIGPAAAALRLTRRVGWTLAVACLIGVGATWLGVLLAYDSYYWWSGHQGLPVSFFIVAVVFTTYLLSGLPATRASRRGAAPPGLRSSMSEPPGRGAAWTEERGTSDEGRRRPKAPRRRAGSTACSRVS